MGTDREYDTLQAELAALQQEKYKQEMKKEIAVLRKQVGKPAPEDAEQFVKDNFTIGI